MHNIPEEAVKAAHEAYDRVAATNPRLSYSTRVAVKAALTAALPFLPVQGAVKKLEWELVSGDHYAEGAGTHYNIYETKPGLWNSVTVKPGNVRLATNVGLEAAKAAAQADFEARILSALEPSAAHKLALEEAAATDDTGNPVNYNHAEAMQVMAKCACKVCGGTGERNDADCGDIYFNTWVCDVCDGKGWDRQAYFEAFPSIRTLSSPDHADAGKVEGDGWLPIESAPKDGTIVLLGWNDPDIEEIGAVAGWYEGGPADKCWYDQYHEPVTATHWMPLRPLPSAPSEGAE